MSDMSDFEQWFAKEFANVDPTEYRGNTFQLGKSNMEYGWNAAKQSMQGEAVDQYALYHLMKAVKNIIDLKSMPKEKFSSLCAAYFQITNSQAQHDLSDLETDCRQHASFVRETLGINLRSNDFYAGWKAVLKRLSVAPVQSQLCEVRSVHIRDNKAVIECWAEKDIQIEFGSTLYTHAPDSAARIAELEAENEALQKELDAHKKSIDYVSDLYRPNKSRSWVMQILREHIDASLNIKGGAE